jgi:hypothetical protein
MPENLSTPGDTNAMQKAAMRDLPAQPVDEREAARVKGGLPEDLQGGSNPVEPGVVIEFTDAGLKKRS